MTKCNDKERINESELAWAVLAQAAGSIFLKSEKNKLYRTVGKIKVDKRKLGLVAFALSGGFHRHLSARRGAGSGTAG